ncbi:twin-arginine translocase TatA/TatE family subunit [Thiothrix fructosivorans]|jgi:sec-independent protein translocase protein TatA|uniref:Sec-independent protein translocase protein TatA n=1 Tax=Thiothrix fructosivorans TaxID=111770 RepID=A0A8B0SMJ0_9GAMM|nr:twin-arginine translocase TatA/TatE family subunit [Thiothrix fructosivorans]MBO0612812.1 twin-arginine translocase TatA/TatE family subunit [Thiothrix fructosivorans]QTX11730.1 twin-arginine translocase TatA/TatE family subunit [Thiothrix fructosivorans]
MFGIWELALILIIVILLFGTKKLRNMGGDLGEALKNFKKGLSNGDETEIKPDVQVNQQAAPNGGRIIDSEAKEKEKV